MYARHALTGLLGFAFSAPVSPQGPSVDIVNPDLSGVRVSVEAKFEPAPPPAVGGLYEYTYVVFNGPPSTGNIFAFEVDITTPFPSLFVPPPPRGSGSIRGRFFAREGAAGVVFHPLGLAVWRHAARVRRLGTASCGHERFLGRSDSSGTGLANPRTPKR